jgi:hypothetical protein
VSEDPYPGIPSGYVPRGPYAGPRPSTREKKISNPGVYEVPVAPGPTPLEIAASQASFCLRTLLPNDPDAQMTVRMLHAALGRA